LLSSSPILRFALEVLDHGLANAVSLRQRDWKIAVLSLAQTIELTVKAALVERNVPIITKDAKTIGIHEGLTALASQLGVERLPMHARVQLLVDERNAIQHKYGSVDDVTLDYHLDTVFQFLRPLLLTEFDLDLDEWLRAESSPDVVSKLRFVQPLPTASEQPLVEQPKELSSTIEFISAFVGFETVVRQVLRNGGLDDTQMGSSLDLVMKALGNAPAPDAGLIRSIPDVYKLRNRIIHGAHVPSPEEVAEALPIIEHASTAMAALPAEVLQRAFIASTLGRRGIKSVPPPSRDDTIDGGASP
jgi:hypothetical protein